MTVTLKNGKRITLHPSQSKQATKAPKRERNHKWGQHDYSIAPASQSQLEKLKHKFSNNYITTHR